MRYRIVETRDNDYIIQKKVLGLFWRDLKEEKYYYCDNIHAFTTYASRCVMKFDSEKRAKEYLEIKALFPTRYRGHKVVFSFGSFVDKSSRYFRYNELCFRVFSNTFEGIKQEIDKIEDKKIELKKPRIKRVCGEYYMGMTYE